MLGVTRDTIPAIEASYLTVLDLLEAHLCRHPYQFGGQPSLVRSARRIPVAGVDRVLQSVERCPIVRRSIGPLGILDRLVVH